LGRQHINFAGHVENEVPTFLGLPQSVPIPDFIGPLTTFVNENTARDDRLLVQTRLQCEPKILARIWGREVVGNAYPDQHDPANFITDRLWGRSLNQWTPAELNDALHRWGIQWVFTCTEPAASLLSETSGSQGEPVGIYRGFRVNGPLSRFLLGSGEMTTAVNRLKLTGVKAKDGLIILRYRYHPAWRAPAGVIVERIAIPEDPLGFLGLRNPPESMELRFDPIALFQSPWQSASSRLVER
jgi:hypothetical protein